MLDGVDLNQLSIEEKQKLLVVIEEKKRSLQTTVADLKALDPFWSFKPSTGSITPEADNFIRKWIKPEDIPTVWDSQLDSFASPAQQILISGGNQVGKTVMAIIKAIIKVTGDIPEGLKGIFPEIKLPKAWPVYGRHYGPSNSMVDEVLVEKYKEWMPKKYWHRDGWERTYNSEKKLLRFYKDGWKFIGQIKFLSYEQDVSKTQGATISFAHFDEEPPYAFYKECLPRFTTKERVDIEIFATPTEGLSWTMTHFLESSDPDTRCMKISTVTNPYANLKVVEKILMGLDSYEERKMRLLGEFVSLSGLIYKGESALRKDTHVIPPFELDYEKYVVYRGMDVHLSKPATVVEIAVDRFGFKYVVGVYRGSARVEEVKKDLALRAAERKYRLAWTRYDKSLDYEMEAMDGINIMTRYKQAPNALQAMFPSDKHKGSRDAGIDKIREDMRLRLIDGKMKPAIMFFDTPEVWQLIRDIQTLERKKGLQEERRGEQDEVNEGPKDCHAAFRYAYQGDLVWLDGDAMGESSGSDEEADRFI